MNTTYLVGVLTFLGIVTILAAAIAVFRSSYFKSIIETQKETIDSQVSRMDEYEATEEDHKRRIEELEATVERQRVQIAALTELATGKAAVEHLSEVLDRHDKAVHEKLDVVLVNQKQALRLLGSKREEDHHE